MSSFLQAIRAESPECLKLSLGVRPAKAAPHRRRPATLSQQTIDHLIAILLRDMKRGLLDLPILPDVAQRVRRLVEDDQTSVAQIAMFLSLDPALSARLLHVANSALYRGIVPIRHLLSAVARLGMGIVRNLVTSMVVLQLFRTRSPALQERIQLLWSHSIEVAAVANLLARQFTRLDAEEAMLAGLLHDIGVLPLISRAERYPELRDNPSALERVIDTLHSAIGRRILMTWNFHPDLVAVATEHGNLKRESAIIDYVDVVMIADLCSYARNEHGSGGVAIEQLAAYRKLGLGKDALAGVMEESDGVIAEIRGFLQG